MFNTRSGFWMLVSIGVLSVIATRAVIIFAPDSAVTYLGFASAIGFPMSVILPLIAIWPSPVVEPARWTHDIHAGAKPWTRDRRQAIRGPAGGGGLHGHRRRGGRHRQRGRFRHRGRRHRVGHSAVHGKPSWCSATSSAWPSASPSASCRNSAAGIVACFVVSLVMPGISSSWPRCALVRGPAAVDRLEHSAGGALRGATDTGRSGRCSPRPR